MLLTRLHLSSMAISGFNGYRVTSIFGSVKPSFTLKSSYSSFGTNAASNYSRSLIRDGNICLKGSPFRQRKGRAACSVMAHQCKIEILGNTASEYRKGHSLYSLSMLGLSKLPFPSPTSSFRFLSNGAGPTYGVFAKRAFSAKTMPKPDLMGTSTSEAVIAKNRIGSKDSSKPFTFNNHRKRVKAIASQDNIARKLVNIFSGQGDNRISPDSQLSAQKSFNMVNCSEVLGKGQKEAKSSSTVDSKQKSKTEIKKLRPQNWKKKEEPSDSQSSSKRVGEKSSQKLKNRNGVSPQASEKSSNENITKEEIDLSQPPAATPQKKNSKSRKKGKPLNEVGVKAKVYDDLPKPKPKLNPQPEEDVKHAPSLKKISKQPKPPTVNGISSIKLKPLYPPVGKSVVVVESLTKAKVIQRYLGDMYDVIPSYGHVRDLAGRSGSVRPDDDFSMVWEVPSRAWTHLKNMKVAISGADNLILAPDPDREGEAIAWHIIEMLQQQDALHKNITVARVTFQEITESAIKSALRTPRDIDVNLVHAYLARRALDYLIGFNISPLLWKKLPGCQSAGRVQSAALALISDREKEIEEFKPQEYWSVNATFSSKAASLSSNCLLRSYLTRFSSANLTQYSIGSEMEAKSIEQSVSASNFSVTGVKRSIAKKNHPTPYITSTLQQDAANKLNFSAAHTMKLAQKLYEGIEFSDGKATGLITYMRTDGLHISDAAAKGICSFITERYGLQYSASSPRKFFKKVKNAQEAHEAIRPTDIRRLPSMLVGTLEQDSLKLYTLIWARTMACQMEATKLDQIQLDIGNDDGAISFRAACSTVSFPGFRLVYEDVETKAINTETESSNRDELYKTLGNLKKGDQLCLGNIEPKQHHSQPPPRYSEASLVKKLEELGIGRPSTYASTIKVLQDRKYVTAKSRVLFPEFRGRMVSAFLSHYFEEVADLSFTADMETELDNVSSGLTEWKGLLKDYWSRFSSYCDQAGKVQNQQVEKMLERTFEKFLFSSLPDEARTCPSCLEGTLIFKVSRFGAGYFIGCDQHPKCKFIAKTLYGEEEDDDEAPRNTNSVEEPKLLGTHATSGEKVFLKAGPYGTYVQLGEDRKGYSPKRTPISQIKDLNSITLEHALDLLRYPISLGKHPVDGQPIEIKISKIGLTIRHRRNFAPVPKNFPRNDITMEKAIELLSGPDVRRCGRPKGKSRFEEPVDG